MDPMIIGTKLKHLRKRAGLSQEELAEVLNVSNRSVSRWENGKTLPDISILIEMSKYYDVSLDYILNKESESDILEKEYASDATIDIIADYTKEERTKLGKGLIAGTIGTMIFFFILSFSHLYMSSANVAVHDVAVAITQVCIFGGLSISGRNFTKVMQLFGGMDKEKHSKYKKVVVVILAVILVFLMLQLLLLQHYL